jgi:thiol-disulfide isomerase/thioredoxin
VDCTIVRGTEGRFRLELRHGDAKELQLLVVSDGKQTTRWLPAEKIYAVDTARDAVTVIHDCVMTQSALDMCGVAFLLRTEVRQSIEAQLLRVVDEGEHELGGKKVQRFELLLQNGRTAQVALPLDGPAVPATVKVTSEIALPDGGQSALVQDTTLQWEIAPKFSAEDFTIELPADARRVDDLSAGILAGDAATLIGKPLPELKLMPLDGSEAQPLRIAGPTVLYFWATWAAPSIDEMPRLNQFVKDMTRAGVETIAVNVGEKPSYVADFVKLNGFEGRVLIEPAGEASDALRLRHLPTVVVVDATGKVRVIKERSDKSFEPELREAVTELLQIKPQSNP